jgi:hypothetical protein
MCNSVKLLLDVVIEYVINQIRVIFACVAAFTRASIQGPVPMFICCGGNLRSTQPQQCLPGKYQCREEHCICWGLPCTVMYIKADL